MLAKENRMDHLKFIVGGVIPPEDIPVLKELGISEVYTPGTPKETIINDLKVLLKNLS